jgi:hypothetical protein
MSKSKHHVGDYPANIFVPSDLGNEDSDYLSEFSEERIDLPQYVDPRVTIFKLQTIILKQRRRIKELEKELHERTVESIKHSEAMSGMILKSLLNGTDPATFVEDTKKKRKRGPHAD